MVSLFLFFGGAGVRGKNPPVTALPCQPPLGKGAEGTEDADCHTSDIGHWLAMTGFFTRGAVQVRAGRYGERTERCRWQKKRGERVAAVKISGVRRKAAWKFWAPQQDHRPLRKCILRCVGEGLCPSHGRGKTPPLRKRYKGRRGVFANVGQPKKEKNAHPCVLFFLERGRKSLATKQFSVSAISWHGRELGAAPHAFPRPALPWR